MESTTKFKLLFEKECFAMESFDVIEKLLKMKIENNLLKIHTHVDEIPYLRVYLVSENVSEYLNIFSDYIYFKILSQRLVEKIRFKPDYYYQSGCFFKNDENREYYDKIINMIWEYKK